MCLYYIHRCSRYNDTMIMEVLSCMRQCIDYMLSISLFGKDPSETHLGLLWRYIHTYYTEFISFTIWIFLRVTSLELKNRSNLAAVKKFGNVKEKIHEGQIAIPQNGYQAHILRGYSEFAGPADIAKWIVGEFTGRNDDKSIHVYSAYQITVTSTEIDTLSKQVFQRACNLTSSINHDEK